MIDALPNNIKIDSQSIDDILVINQITIKNSGKYVCRVENKKWLVYRDDSNLIVERK